VFREDDILRYLVHRIGKVEPYEWHKCTLEAGQHNEGVQGNICHRQAPFAALTYGPESSAEHAAEDAVDALLGGLAEHSRDVPLALVAGAPA
jgi:hypothetical protein